MQYGAGVPVYNRVDSKKEKITKYKLTAAKIILILLCGFMLSRVKFSVVDGLMIAPFGMAFLISVINKRKSKETIFAFLGVIIGYLSVFSTDCDSYVYPILAISILLISCITNKVGKKIKINNICIICVIEFLIIKSIFGSQGLSVNIAFALIESLSIIPVFYVVNYGVGCLDEIKHNYFFNMEELISMAIVLCLMVAGAGNIALFGVSIRNIAALSIIIVIAYAGGASIGAVIGVTMGIIVGVTSKNILLFINSINSFPYFVPILFIHFSCFNLKFFLLFIIS